MSTAAWHAASEKSVMEALMTDKASGLTKKEVRNRARRYGLNRIYKEERASGLQYLGYCFSDLMLILLLVTAATAAVFGEEEEYTHASASDAGTAEYTVNINTATAQELDKLLPGIGEKKAAAIIEHRQRVGGFRSVEELIEVDGIGPGLLDDIRPYCRLED